MAQTVTPYLIVPDADATLAFVERVFGGAERYRMTHEGRVVHAEFTIGDSLVMLASESPEHPATVTLLHIAVDDCDATYAAALAAGAASARAPADQFYGERNAQVEAAGVRWSLAQRVEDVPDDEVLRRFAGLSSNGGAP